MTGNQLSRVLQHLRRAAAPAREDGSDAQLVERFSRQHDQAAFAVLLERHGPMVLGVCRRALGDAHEAEDAFQATFLLLVRKAASLRNADLVGNWLYGVACRVARRARAQAARRARSAPEVPEMTTTLPPETPWSDLGPILDEELQHLPRKYRAPVVLCYLQGKTNEAAARQLRLPEGTVKTRLAKARELLRARLARRGHVVSAGAVAAALTPEAVRAAVPASLSEATLEMAALYAAGSGAAVSSSVAGLVAGTLREMFWVRAQAAAAVLLAFVLLGGGAGLLAYEVLGPTAAEPEVAMPAPETPPLDDAGLAADVHQRVAAWQPTRAERRIDDIGWAADLRDGLRLARQHQRPLFVLSHSGDIATARCIASAFHVRASALSADRVIQTLNHNYVCVHLNHKDYLPDGKASAEEKAAFDRLREAWAAFPNVDRSSVICLLDCDGRLVECRNACFTAMTDTLAPLLERLVPQPGQAGPVVAPRTQSRPPQAAGDDLVLHLTVRYLERTPTVLGRNTNYKMKGCPGENWIVFDPRQAAALLPAGPVQPGLTWTIDPATLVPLYQHMYPPTEDNNLAANRIDAATLTATVVAGERGVYRARLDGSLRMKHRFDPAKEDDKFVDASFTGYLDFTTSPPAVRAFQLVSTQATYGKGDIGIAVRSVPR